MCWYCRWPEHGTMRENGRVRKTTGWEERGENEKRGEEGMQGGREKRRGGGNWRIGLKERRGKGWVRKTKAMDERGEEHRRRERR